MPVIRVLHDIIVQKEPDDVDKPFLYLAEQFYQIYTEKAEEQT